MLIVKTKSNSNINKFSSIIKHVISIIGKEINPERLFLREDGGAGAGVGDAVQATTAISGDRCGGSQYYIFSWTTTQDALRICYFKITKNEHRINYNRVLSENFILNDIYNSWVAKFIKNRSFILLDQLMIFKILGTYQGI